MGIEFEKSCKSCKNCYRLQKHPGNFTSQFRGPVTESFGYVCAGFQSENRMVFFDTPDGLCELYEKSEEYKQCEC